MKPGTPSQNRVLRLRHVSPRRLFVPKVGYPYLKPFIVFSIVWKPESRVPHLPQLHRGRVGYHESRFSLSRPTTRAGCPRSGVPADRSSSVGWRSPLLTPRTPPRRTPTVHCSLTTRRYGTNTWIRTCHLVLSPGFSVTMPVSVFPHSFPNGSPKLYWCSTATNCLATGAYTWIALIAGESP